jgi:phenylglyoxylate dehydrogenase epsilon subunit
MDHTKYLIIGSSHAGLSALDAIRVQDKEGPLTLVSQENCLPYSPTILPYVLSGQRDPDKVFLRNQEALHELRVSFKPGARVVAVNASKHRVALASGESIGYEKLLLATGAEPKLPPVEGLQDISYHVLRTIEDATKLRIALGGARSAVVLGGGLIGLHAAENLAAGGMEVTVVEALPRLLAGYFDEEAAGLIRKAFVDKGVKVLTGERVTGAAKERRGCLLTLASGKNISGDLLVIATGVRPRTDYLAASGVEVDEGILVDERMRTSAEDIWAAGDVAQAVSFFDATKRVNAILPSAVEQGRIAGMDMVEDPWLKPFEGAIPLNSYRFFGHRAFSVGVVPDAEGIEVEKVFLPEGCTYRKLVFKDDRLVGAQGINSGLDPGLMHQLILRRVYLGEVKARFCANPLESGRVLMTSIWR